MAGFTREEILKRIEIEDTRIANADRNIEGLILQKNKSLDEQTRLFALLGVLDTEEELLEGVYSTERGLR